MFVDMTADIAHTLHPHRQLLVAFSGGLDSTVLLHQLVLLREQDPSLTLRAVHVHHGLSVHADDWVAHCRQICQQWQVPLVVHHVTLAREGWASRPTLVRRAIRPFRIRSMPARC